MEDFDLVKSIPETSVGSDHKISPCSLGLNVHTHRSSLHLCTNAVSSFPGKTGPAVGQDAVQAVASLMQELQHSGKTDSELWKNCETRWFQLFSLVEKQCQEQIVAQQEQFHHQIQCIQEEIKNLVKLQTSDVSWVSCDRSSSSKQVSSESQMGFLSPSSGRHERGDSCPEPKEPEARRAACLLPDSAVDSGSVSSGYGTFCISELNSDWAMEPPGASEGQRGAPRDQMGSPGHGVKHKTFYTQATKELCDSSTAEGSIFPGELEHKFLEENRISEVCNGQASSSKSLTSWAQKLKQSQSNRAQEEACSRSKQGNEQSKPSPSEQADFATTMHPRTFHLSKPEESPSCWESDSGTGLTYWRLEEKDLYHSLPDTLEKAFIPSPCTDLSPSQVLTLDPALRLKATQQVSGPPSRDFVNTLDDRISFSPDSVLEPSVSSHSDIDSFSQTSNIAAQLSGFPKYPSKTQASPVDSWKNHTFQTQSRSSSTFPSVCTLASNDLSVNTVDEEHTVLVASTSVSQSQLPGTANSVPECIALTSLDDPVMLSKIRQSLKEKHARHVADLRAYYESEIASLKQKLEAKEMSAVEDWKKTNQILVDRCSQLDSALNEATCRVRTLENRNNLLEVEVNDLRERFGAASSASKLLQERIEEMRTSNKEKDKTIIRLKSRLQDLEGAFENAYKLSDDKEARLRQENKMFQDLLGEYESLGKEHSQVKDTLNTTENKLLDAHTQISDLKRTISKLEAQVKQVEHENMLSLRHHSGTPARPSRASTVATADVSRRKWLIPGAQYSIFTGQPLDSQHSHVDSQLEEACAPRYCSPPEKDLLPASSSTSLLVKKQREVSDTPVMKALKELDEEKMFKNWGTQTEKEDTSNRSVSPRRLETPVTASRCPEKCAQQRPRRLGPASQRSSSLPPSSRKSSTPTKREIMLTPVTVAYSPKRSPKENLSPGFSHLRSNTESSPARCDVLLDDSDTIPVSALQHTNPRKQLHFLNLDDLEAAHAQSPPSGPVSIDEKNYSEKATDSHINHSSCPERLPSGVKKAPVRAAWDEWESAGRQPCEPVPVTAQGADFEYTAKIRTLAETERFFDELTKEKDQIEAALSRMPSPRGRVTLQTRLNQEALEDRLERINRELGSVRMTLKKFHILRTSANL